MARNNHFSPETKKRVLEFIEQNQAPRRVVADVLQLSRDTVGKVVAAQRDEPGAKPIVTDPETMNYIFPKINDRNLVDAWEKSRRKRMRTEVARIVTTLRNFQEEVGTNTEAARALSKAVKAVDYAGEILDF